ncbi:hypothetical protein ABZ512_00940 [Nocardiopsis dassonvillei]|uniref:hypothetical protein n=1 Tax=Nocardiopsis dassonvillei TaxID=2014 RepID=UPI0033CC6304
MGGRLRDVLGWSGIAVLAGALVLTVPRAVGFSGDEVADGQSLSFLVWASLVLALGVGALSLASSAYASADPPEKPGATGVLTRAAVVLAGLALVWAAFPTRHLVPTVRNDGYRMFPDAVTALWIGVCLVALGLVLLLAFSGPVLPLRRWKRLLTGLVAGALAVVLVWVLTPALTRILTVDHTVAGAAGEPAPVPDTVSRVGWSWRPEHPVLGVERGPRGPVVRYADGFTALDGATGEELWTYRLPYARQVRTGVFAGQDRYAYLLHVAEARPEPETRTMVVLDAGTGEVVRDAPVPELVREGEEDPLNVLHLTPDVRVALVPGQGGPAVVAHATDSTERLWEFPLRDEPEGRMCRWADNGGIRGHGDRVLVARLCLDRLDVVEEYLSATLADMDVPEDAVESVIALDTATGQQVWRHDWAPQDLLIAGPPGVSGPREGSAGESVAVTRGGVFALADGAPVQARPRTPEGADDRLLAIDTEGAVVVRVLEDDAPALLLRTDADGEVVERTRVDQDLDLWWDMGRAQVLGAALAVPHIGDDDAGHQVRALSVRPLEGGETPEGGWTRVGFDGERVPEPTESWQSEVEHRLLAVPGAVVSYLADPNEPGFDPAPLHGLVP